MADTTSRTLRLLSLLQRRRYWPGPELADRLEVSDRTLRRDIDRLRELGYTVDSERGIDGGYRLAGSGGDTVLLLDDDETIALAAALHTAASETSQLAEAALGALTKVLTMLKPEQRRRADAVRVATAVSLAPATNSPPLDVLDALASSCRDQVRVSFDYVSAKDVATRRYVEAHQLLTFGSRWYLFAYDCDRLDWRTFRLDRITVPVPTHNPYPPRAVPATDLREYVSSSLRSAHNGQRVVVEATTDAAEIRRRYGRWVTVEDLADGRCRMVMDVDSFEWPTHIIAAIDAQFQVIEPPAFQEHLQSVADRFRPSSAAT